MSNIIHIDGINIPIIINEMCEDYKILKTSQSNMSLGVQPNCIKKQSCFIMNKKTFEATTFLLNNYDCSDYTIFFRSFGFDEAVNLSCRAALMMIGENVRANIEHSLS